MYTKFAGHIKLGGSADSFEKRGVLWRNLDKSQGWAITNHMEFIKSNFQILQVR